MGKIKIDYEKVNDTSLAYIDEAERILDIKIEMKEIYERLSEEWKEEANNGFNTKFESQIDKLDDFIDFLSNSSLYLNDISNKHSASEDSFKSNMEKVRDLYEYRN